MFLNIPLCNMFYFLLSVLISFSVATGEDSKVLMIFLIVFFIVLLLLILVMCFCCRSRISEKYYEMKIKADTMKAE